MPFRRGGAIRPVNSIKHIIDTVGALTAGGRSVNVIVNAVPNVDETTFVPGNVRVGSKVNGIYLSIFMQGASGASGGGAALDWFIIKVHEGQSASVPEPGTTGTSKIRNQIIHEEKGLAGSVDGSPMAFKGVVVIPRGMRRFREGDTIQVVLKAPNQAANDVNFCVKAIYKSYF